MGIKDNVGTLLSVIVGGVPFTVHGDVDATQLLAEWETEALPTSGRPLYKMTKVVPKAESIDIAANEDEFVVLSAYAESRLDIPLGFVTASGSTWTGVGRIKLDSHSKAQGKVAVTMMFSSKPIKVG